MNRHTKNLILRAYRDGRTILEIEQATGLDRELIYEVIDEAKAPRHTRPRLGDDPPELTDEILAKLDPREAMILKLRLGVDRGRPRTHVEVGEHLGLSPSRIRQIEKKALLKLRA